MDWIKGLLLLHVLSAIIGIGPTYFFHVLLKSNQTVEQLRTSMRLSQKLEKFPKIGGSLAVLSGIALVFAAGYSFSEWWIIISIALYVLIQIVVIGFVAPRSKTLIAWLSETSTDDKSQVPEEQAHVLTRMDRLMYVASAMGILLFVMMFIRPGF